MPIRSEEELANVVGLSLQSYANRVLNGAVQPFLGLLKEGSVEVTFVVTEEGGFAVKREPIVYSMPKVELPIQITTEPRDVIVDPVPVLHNDIGSGVIVMEEVPKKKRTRKKKEKPVENPSPISA